MFWNDDNQDNQAHDDATQHDNHLDPTTSTPTDPQDNDFSSGMPLSSPALPPTDLPTLPANDQQAAVPAQDITADTSSDAPSPTLNDQDIGDSDLLTIKQQALHQLSPLVGHLEQTPEEKFRTTMMMIQASDDQSLIKEAYTAAQAITDEKGRAQALLDIINEINYFTQQSADK